MDILTHALSAACAGSVVMAYCKKPRYRVAALGASIVAGVLPDIDAISMWSGFNRTFGQWFGLAESGRDIYHGMHWYSHHGFIHSLCAALLLSFIVWLLLRLWRNHDENKFVALAFVAGYAMHLLGDMITPGGPWGGVRLLFPLPLYVGGSGTVWWWNNYDIFLSCLLFALLGIGVAFWGKKNSKKRITRLLCTVWLASIALFATTTRNHNFNTDDYGKNEPYSKEVQQKILPAPIYKFMDNFDRWLKPMF